MENEAIKKEAFQRGVAVFILLVFLSLGEYLMGRFAPVWALPILIIALIKAVFVIKDYMHIGRVFESEEEQA